LFSFFIFFRQCHSFVILLSSDPTTNAVVEYLKVHDLGVNAIAANSGSADFVNITIRYNEVFYFYCFYYAKQ